MNEPYQKEVQLDININICSRSRSFLLTVNTPLFHRSASRQILNVYQSTKSQLEKKTKQNKTANNVNVNFSDNA